ncbi:MAG TPA: CRISPR system precrRNA processing endoribonuclease RAMP protein Cas6 [Clostridia bacterium]|nr:CRISPR system precrRNA processing endoribonuclease RAMP protein Cas6 [Clostridia bacterium]
MRQYRFSIEYHKGFSFSWGYALYSAFLEKLKGDEAQKIHRNTFFNQYITHRGWVINTTEEHSFEKEYFLDKFNVSIHLKEGSLRQFSEQDLADKFLVKDPYKRNMRVNFLTPTTFKQAGEYVLYPTKDLVMQSLTNKWNQWAKNFVIEDMTWDNCKIARYNLRSSSYKLKGAHIQGFMGYIDLYFWGPESIIRLGNLVCNFANHSGIGIKTTLGMGGAKVE